MNIQPTFWAKLGAAEWPDTYHPAVCHLADVGQVAIRIWERVLGDRVRGWIASRLGLDDPADAGRWLAFWTAAHDIGKLAPGFQHRGPNTARLKDRLAREGFDFPGGAVPHGTLSTAVLAAELARPTGWPAVDPATATAAAVTVGGHHGVFPDDWADIRGPLGNARWTEARRTLLAGLARWFGVVGRPAPAPPGSDQAVWMFVAGLTAVADWVGSNVAFFPPAGNPAVAAGRLDEDDYVLRAGGMADRALDELGWLDRAGAGEVLDFAARFDQFAPRPLQTAVGRLATAADRPGLLVVEAPMGEGKTETAWYAAEVWDRRGGQGTYVALPTMATSNQMFDRVGRFLADGPGKKNLMLQHGKAAMNEGFEALMRKAEEVRHNRGIESQVFDDDKRPSGVVAEEWFAKNKKHGLLAPYGVGTIDQALLAVLQTKHVFVRLFGLAGKCVILDEVHAYDAYMTTLLERLLRWLAALGCPVVLLSATLPREKRLKLLQAYAGGDALPEPAWGAYPRITTVTPGGSQPTVEVVPVAADESRRRTVHLDWTPEAGLAAGLRKVLADGGCAAVIRNTVGLAQRTYRELKAALEPAGIRMELFHARFPFGRRQEIENAVLKRYGKNGGPADRDRWVLVATQVVEQSLDLDFDLMVSDVAPVDLVLQRAGRLWRHKRSEPRGSITEAQLWLIEPATKDGLPDFGPSEWVYARYVLLRSYLVLRRTSVNLPEQLEELIEQVYGDSVTDVPAAWQLPLSGCRRELSEEQRTQRYKAKGVMVYKPDDEELLSQPSAQLEEDNPEAATQIRAATRDTEPTVQVVLVYRLGESDFLDPDGRVPFDESVKPSVPDIRRILDNEVTVNHRGCVAALTPRAVPSGWRKCGLLRHHRAVRLDGNGISIPDECPLRYAPDAGLEFTRDTDEGTNG